MDGVSMPTGKKEKRVLMARQVAKRWICRLAHTEYRLQILFGTKEIKNLPGLLRSFRDGKISISGVPKIPDLGVSDSFDSVTVWSADREGLIALKNWFEERTFETSGIW